VTVKNRGDGAWLYNNVSSPFLFLSGFLFAIAIIFQRNLIFKTVEFVIILMLLILLKKSIKLFISTILFLAIVFFNALSPAGRVLYRIGRFVITKDALELGIKKGLDIVSLFYLSKIIIRRDLILPGKIGMVLGRAFVYLNLLFENREKLDIREPIKSIDQIMLDVYNSSIVVNKRNSSRTTVKGALVLFFFLSTSFLIIFF